MSYKSQIRKLNLIYKSQLPKAIQARNLAFTALSETDKKKEIADADRKASEPPPPPPRPKEGKYILLAQNVEGNPIRICYITLK